MAFRQIAVSPGEMNRAYAGVNDGLAAGISKFSDEIKDISGKWSQAQLLHKFNVNNWQDVFKNATAGSADMALNLAKIGLAHDELSLQQQQRAAMAAAQNAENSLYQQHGWDFVDALARLQGSVEIPEHEVTEDIGSPDGGSQLGTYRVPGRTLWDPAKVVADLKAHYGDMPLSKSAVAELSDVLQKGYGNATSLAWHAMNDATRREISATTLQTRRDLAATKAPATPEEKDTLAHNSKQRLLASQNGVGFDELVADKTGRLQPPPRVQAAGGWDSFKAMAIKQRMQDRLAYERETRTLIQRQAQEFETKKAEAALNAKDATAVQREVDKKYADLRKHIEADMTDKSIYDYDEKGEKREITLRGDAAGEAYWRRLAPYTTKDIMNFAVSQRDENALYAWLAKTFMVGPDGKIGETIPPGVDEALGNLARAATDSNDPQFRAFAGSVVKSVNLAKFKLFLRDARALDEMR